MKTIPARELRELFAPLLEHFDPAYEGEHYHKEGIRDCLDFDSLGEVIQDHWPIFNGSMDYEEINDLLDSIRGLDSLHPDDDRERTPSDMSWASKEEHLLYERPEHLWAEFADQIKSQRRFIFTDRFSRPQDRPERWVRPALEALGAVRSLSTDERLFRARLGFLAASGADDRRPFPL